MKRAVELAELAGSMGEIPVGAVVVKRETGEIVAEGYNRRESDKNALAHAEIEAIGQACKTLGGWRLHKADLFVTLEPCIMCAGACINARINRVYYGAADKRYGCFGGFTDLREKPFNHLPLVYGGIMEEECAELIKRFFEELRR